MQIDKDVEIPLKTNTEIFRSMEIGDSIVYRRRNIARGKLQGLSSSYAAAAQAKKRAARVTGYKFLMRWSPDDKQYRIWRIE